MNLYTKLLCYLGLIKAPTLDIVQWIKDNPDCVVVDDWFFRTYGFIYKDKNFHVISWFDVQVDSVKGVFSLFEEMLIHKTVRNINFNQDKGIPDNERIRKELLE
jgi:hypothetical protein